MSDLLKPPHGNTNSLGLARVTMELQVCRVQVVQTTPYSHLQARPAGQPLITVSNHVAAMDDPLLLAALTPFRRCRT